MTYREARTNAGLSQEKAAKLIGVSPPAISYWENGKTIPRLQMLMRMAKVYGVPAGDLIGDEES